MDDKTLDQTLNIGSEIRLSEGCVKRVRIGSIKLIREVRQVMSEVAQYTFSFSIGRGKIKVGDKEIDFSQVEKAYRKAFGMVLVDGLTDEEYDNVDEQGLKELDELLNRFLY